jgi:hypothetical protein
MFGVSSPRRWVLSLVLGLTVLTFVGLTGCSKEEVVDPYVYDSVRRVMDGDTLSVGFLFEIDAPEVEYVAGDVAVMRNGNLLNFLVGQDLENNLAGLRGSLLGVKKTFTPQPTHLVIQRIKRDGLVVEDSIPAPKGYVLPRLLRAGAISQDLPGAPLPDVGYRAAGIKEAQATYLPENEGDPVKTIKSAFANFVYQPRFDLPEAVEGEAPAQLTEEDYAWYAIGSECFFEIVDLTAGAEYMMNLLLEKDLPLIGAFTVTELEEAYAVRKIDHEGLGHYVGKIRVNWFQYANTYIEAFQE